MASISNEENEEYDNGEHEGHDWKKRFFPVRESSCKTGWIIDQSEITSGTVGKLYSACCGEKCTYIAKHIDFKVYNNKSYIESTFNDEVRTQMIMDNLILAPKVHDYWSCSHGGMIIMDRLDMTLHEAIYRLYRLKPIMIYALIKEFISGIFVMNSMKICHDDIHLENVMLKVKNDRDLQMGEYTLMFIDFGVSYMITEKRPRCNDGKDIYYGLYDFWLDEFSTNQNTRNKGDFYIKLSLVLLYKTFKICSKDYPKDPVISKEPVISEQDYIMFGTDLPDNERPQALSFDYRYNKNIFNRT